MPMTFHLVARSIALRSLAMKLISSARALSRRPGHRHGRNRRRSLKCDGRNWLWPWWCCCCSTCRHGSRLLHRTTNSRRSVPTLNRLRTFPLGREAHSRSRPWRHNGPFTETPVAGQL
ncbi:uncharacterized protein HMPREF1120_03109 [Exophiala dermatitidis NIH/UT8656]|uniref:Uncharacterized protein n=1 Tax=Exophiala dermatitidis (strain ATCC 34100 / CBS 525.76 / NIH/UT8656) TaxID=858893 RepID=H6BUY0_EXODN|nr:uncharacterized protein HMPREF1120_03109 [Exophiala dermatitidis NIH/UT8656]EHY54950.1 hypothetical protein HMPREF1120_03109 [Exophiala dermatitidis NIH/UT8656]